MDLDADPCQDFYRYACGRWQDENEQTLRRSVYKEQVARSWDEAQENSRAQVFVRGGESLNQSSEEASHLAVACNSSCVLDRPMYLRASIAEEQEEKEKVCGKVDGAFIHAHVSRPRWQEMKVLEQDQGPAGIMFRSCMNVDHIEEIGGRPLRPWLEVIDAIEDKPALMRAVVVYNLHQVDSLFKWGVSSDPRNHSRNIFAISPPPVSLPDKTYYLEHTAEMRKHRDTLVAVMSRFFQLVGYEEAAASDKARRVLAWETQVRGPAPLASAPITLNPSF